MASTNTVFLVQVTDYYGYPVSRTVITGVYSSAEAARSAVERDGAVVDNGRWIIPCDGDDPSSVDILEFKVDHDGPPKRVI